MATVVTFKYDCGYAVDMPLGPGMTKSSLARWAWPIVQRRHRLECASCRLRRSDTALRRWHGDEYVEQLKAAREKEQAERQIPMDEPIVFTTKATRNLAS